MAKSMSSFAQTPERSYYAVIFSSQRTPDDAGYAETADRMAALAQGMPGFLGMESARGLGIRVSYWTGEDTISNWQRHAEHKVAQRLGKHHWYGTMTCVWPTWNALIPARPAAESKGNPPGPPESELLAFMTIGKSPAIDPQWSRKWIDMQGAKTIRGTQHKATSVHA